MSELKFSGGTNPASMSDRELAERFMDGGEDYFDDPEEFDDAVSNLEFLLRSVRSTGIASAPTIAARLDEAVGLLRDVQGKLRVTQSEDSRIAAFLAAIDTEKTREGT